MKNHSAWREGVARALRHLAATGLLAALVSPWAAVAQPAAAARKPGPPASAPVAPAANTQPRELERRRQWQSEIAALPAPKRGCFSTAYPSKEWREVACYAPSRHPNQPGRSPQPNNVGHGNHVTAVSSGVIRAATGSFASVTPASVSASGPVPGTLGTIGPDAFTLQLNSQFFDTAACAGRPNCKGWQQFLYSRYQGQPNPRIFIEYWLLGYGSACPTGWDQTGSDCYLNSPATYAPAITAADLPQVTLTGKAAGGPGGTDQVVLTTAGGLATTATAPNQLGLDQRWNTVEWNVVGDCCINRVDFSPGTSITARITLNDGSPNAPTCVAQGFTAEANNLNFGPGAPTASGAGPGLLFMQSDPGGALPSNCAAATTFGDTHLRTFHGLLYDFQASGDFVLARVDPDFVVHTRQVSGAPNWPDASVNSAVGMRLGKVQVVICLPPGRLYVDGKAAELSEGKPLTLPDGAVVSRTGNVYVARGRSGDSVRAEVHAGWIDVAVGLGRWPAKVGGLLANAQGDVNKIAARDGTVLTNPFPFEVLYGRYANSWRVAADESLLSVCGQKEVERGVPRRLFHANDLDPKVRERGRGACSEAGVKLPALLEPCTLDVAVIGEAAAARVFIGMPAPAAVASVVAIATDDGWRSRAMRWLPWAALVVLTVGALFALLRRRRRP